MVCSSFRSSRFPEVQTAAVAAGGHVLEIEAGLECVRFAELGGDEHVLARLVPEVVVHRRLIAPVLPAALDFEGLGVEDGEAARSAAFGVAEHADDDVLARHAVDGVGSAVAGLADDLLRLDHLLDRGRARIVGDVEDVDRDERKPGTIRCERSARGTPSCTGSSRSDGARRRRSASTSC
jgi:hypothetical protein